MKTAFASLLLILLASFALIRAEPPAAPKQTDPIVGRWRYWNGEMNRLVTLTEDGHATSSSGVSGKWIYVPGAEVERKYKIIFKDGLYIDEVALSSSGKHLNGRNAKKQNIRAERIEP